MENSPSLLLFFMQLYANVKVVTPTGKEKQNEIINIKEIIIINRKEPGGFC